MTSQSSQHVDKADKGYNKALKPRHMQMIAIGGSIGTGLFLGAGGRISMGGPALAFAYALCGLFAFFMIRALGELTIYRPSSGAFVSYAREFQGEGGAYATGWLFFLDWSVTVMADITAVALYVHYWSIFTSIPQWILAFGALAIVFVLNLLSVKVFGELEFWFALIKVAAIVIFMIIAIIFIVTGNSTAGYEPGIQLIRDNGGLFPEGFAPMVTLALGVVFAFGGTENGGAERGLFGVGLEVLVVGRRGAGADEEGLLIVLVAVVVDVDDGADDSHAVDDTCALGGGVSQQLGDLLDAGFFLVLLLAGGVVAGVLLEVALLAALVDLSRDGGAVINELLQFGLELGLHFRSDVLLLGFSHRGLNLP